MTSTLATQDQALAKLLPTPIEPASAPEVPYRDPRLVWIGMPKEAINQLQADAKKKRFSDEQVEDAKKLLQDRPYWQFSNETQRFAPINTKKNLRNLQLVELKIHLHKHNEQTGRKDKALNAHVRVVSEADDIREYIFKPSLYSMWSQSFLVSCLNMLDSEAGILQPFTLQTKKGNNESCYFASLYGSDFNRDKISKSSLELRQKFNSFRAECNAQDERWNYGQHPGLREAFLEAFDQINEALAEAYRSDDDEVMETTAEAA